MRDKKDQGSFGLSFVPGRSSSRSQTNNATPKQIARPTGTTSSPQKFRLESVIRVAACRLRAKKANYALRNWLSRSMLSRTQDNRGPRPLCGAQEAPGRSGCAKYDKRASD